MTTRTRHVAAFLDEVDRLGSFFNAVAIERPQPVDDRRFKLTRPCWPDCPICGATVEDCQCDPDDYQVALIRQSMTLGM